MSTKVQYYVKCDGYKVDGSKCQETTVTGSTKKQARLYASFAGWLSDGDLDLCPDCKTRQTLDLVTGVENTVRHPSLPPVVDDIPF